MNKYSYRVVFNQATGVMTAVSELANAYVSKPIARQTRSGALLKYFQLHPLTVISSLLLSHFICVNSSYAHIVADSSALGNQQPTIIETANGIPQVNIQTPSAAGVSRNKFSQFDVNNKGVILNNARKPTQTELAGKVDANPWLSQGEARIILNEVNSKNPSHLNGFIEVAGQKAQVIIANPSGVTCDGCGFINSQRATLTTGEMIVQNDAITGYEVNNGKIVIQGRGLDSTRQDKTDLIARAVEVNADVWANDLSVTTGQNVVDAEHKTITQIAIKNGDQSEINTTQPVFAIDVSELGGMYAGKIHLVGTEQGVGVRNAGEIGASVGDIMLSADGQVINTGSIQARGNVELTSLSEDMVNSGKIYSEKTLALTADTLLNEGKIESHQNQTIGVRNLVNRHELHSNQDIHIQAIELNNDGIIHAKASLDISSEKINNTGEISSGGKLLVTNDTLVNGGKIVSTGNISIESKGLITNQGQIASRQGVSIKTNALESPGSVHSEKDMLVELTKDYKHTGDFVANGKLKVNVAGHIENLGQFWAAQEASIAGLTFENKHNASVIAHRLDMQIKDALINAGLIDGITTRIKTHQLTNHATGKIYGDVIELETHTLKNINDSDKGAVEDNPSATIAARQKLSIGTDVLFNDWHSLIFSGGDLYIGGYLTQDNQVAGRATLIENRSAKIESLGDMYLQSDYLLNVNDKLILTQVQKNEVSFDEAGFWGGNDFYKFSDVSVRYDRDDISYLVLPNGRTSNDWVRKNYTRLFSEDELLETHPGEILSGGQLVIKADKLDNKDSHIFSTKDLTTEVNTLNNFETVGFKYIADRGYAMRYFPKYSNGPGSKPSQATQYMNILNVDKTKLNLGLSMIKGNQSLSLSENIGESAAKGIETQLPDFSIPTNSEYTVNPRGKPDYSVETDPLFTDRKTWLGLDYMFKAFNSNHNNQHKRLSDRFYEQQRYNEKRMGLTGNHYLGNHSNEEGIFKEIIGAGITYAKAFSLTPGISITEDKMTELTSNLALPLE